MDKQFHPTFYWAWNYLSMPGLKWIHVKEKELQRSNRMYIRCLFWHEIGLDITMFDGSLNAGLGDDKDNASLLWRHNECNGISNHQPHGCLLNRLFRRRSKKTSKLRVTGLCAGNSPVTGEVPTQRASNAVNDSISKRHHDTFGTSQVFIHFNNNYTKDHIDIESQCYDIRSVSGESDMISDSKVLRIDLD